MIEKWRSAYPETLFWGISLLFILPVFPRESFTSLSVILMGSIWLFGGNWKVRLQRLKQHIWPVILISSPFLIAVIGYVFRQTETDALALKTKLPFFVVGVILSTVSISKNTFFRCLQILVWSVFVSTGLAIAKLLYFKFNHLGGSFYYDDFARFLDKQASYYSVYVVVCWCYLLYDLLRLRKWKVWLNIGFQIFMAFLLIVLSVRISIVAFGAGAIVLLISWMRQTPKRKWTVWLIPALLAIYAIGTVNSPNFQKRFHSVNELGEPYQNELTVRTLHWKAVWQTINSHSFLVGYLYEDPYPGLFDRYKALGFKQGYLNKYNAHNQYLESMLCYGVVGLMVLLLLIAYPLFIAIKRKDGLSVALLLVFAIYMITESLLQRLSGIHIMAVVLTMMLNVDVKKPGLKQ